MEAGMNTRRCQIVILIALALSGCVKALPIPLTMASLPPTALPAWPRELVDTRWVLDHIVVNGQRQPPYSPHADQTIAFNSALDYGAYDGCNSFH
jgi:heat shock protein HslJ